MFDPASIGAALGSVRAIVDLAKSANDAQLAAKINVEVSNLQGRLIDVQQQAIAVQNENQRLQDEVRELTKKLSATVSAAACPRCLKKGYRVESSEPDPVFGVLGGSRRIYKCDFCAFTESKVEK